MTTPPSSEDTASQLESILNAYGQSLENPPAQAQAVPDFRVTHPNSAAKYDYREDGTLLGPKAEAVPQPKVKKRVKIEPDPASRLAYLLAQLPGLESQKKEAEEKLSECKRAVQQEVAAFAAANDIEIPDIFDLPADPYGAHPAYTLSAREGAWRVDTDAMKSQAPEEYVRWAKKGQPYWELKRKSTNRVHRG